MEMSSPRPHFLVLTYPLQGRIAPALRLARWLLAVAPDVLVRHRGEREAVPLGGPEGQQDDARGGGVELGEPMVGVPKVSEQSTNARLIEREWRIGVRAQVDGGCVLRAAELGRCVGRGCHGGRDGRG